MIPEIIDILQNLLKPEFGAAALAIASMAILMKYTTLGDLEPRYKAILSFGVSLVSFTIIGAMAKYIPADMSQAVIKFLITWLGLMGGHNLFKSAIANK